MTSLVNSWSLGGGRVNIDGGAGKLGSIFSPTTTLPARPGRPTYMWGITDPPSRPSDLAVLLIFSPVEILILLSFCACLCVRVHTCVS